MAMIRYSRIVYDNLTDEQLKDLYLKFKSNSNFKSANQMTNLLDYLVKSQRLEAVLEY